MEPLKGCEIYQKTIVLKSTILAIGGKYKIDYELPDFLTFGCDIAHVLGTDE